MTGLSRLINLRGGVQPFSGCLWRTLTLLTCSTRAVAPTKTQLQSTLHALSGWMEDLADVPG